MFGFVKSGHIYSTFGLCATLYTVKPPLSNTSFLTDATNARIELTAIVVPY